MQLQPHVDQIEPRDRSEGCVGEGEVSNATLFTPAARCAIKPGGRAASFEHDGSYHGEWRREEPLPETEGGVRETLREEPTKVD